MARPRQPQTCCASLCLRDIAPDEKGVVITMFCETFGTGKRRHSKAQRLALCPQCATRTVSGKEPSKTEPFNMAVFRTLLDLVGAEADVVHATFEQLHQRREEILYGQKHPELPEAEILPPVKRLREAS
jgi:hypothetical protein